MSDMVPLPIRDEATAQFWRATREATTTGDTTDDVDCQFNDRLLRFEAWLAAGEPGGVLPEVGPAEVDAPASPQWVAAHANTLLYEVLTRFGSIGGGVQYSAIVDSEQFRAWRERAERLAEIAAHPDYGRANGEIAGA